MKSGSYSSYRAALPIEALDGPDDEPLPGVEYWRSRDTPGTFDVWIRSGWGRSEGRTRRIRSGLSLEEATIIAKDLDARYQDRLAERYGAEADAEDARDARIEADVAAYHAAMDEADSRLVATANQRCEWCGGDLPDGHARDVCQACIEGVQRAYRQESKLMDDSDFCYGDLPW